MGCYLVYLDIITNKQYDDNDKLTHHSGGFSVTDKGELWISNLFGDTSYQGIFDYYRQSEALDKFKKEHLDPYIKIYSFADLLKKEVCMKILGLTYEQCYGTDDDKNSLTELKWDDMPGVCNDDEVNDILQWYGTIMYHPLGQMTAREVLQFVGTEIFRKMYGNVWVDALMRQVKQDNPVISIITDIRFENEVRCIQDAGGKVLRFTRAPFADQDEHDSEKALDQENYDWSKFDKILDNANTTIKQHNQLVYTALAPWGLIPDLYEGILKEENK